MILVINKLFNYFSTKFILYAFFAIFADFRSVKFLAATFKDFTIFFLKKI